jgi:hypothetical protein
VAWLIRQSPRSFHNIDAQRPRELQFWQQTEGAVIEPLQLIEALPNGRAQDFCVAAMLDRGPPTMELALPGTIMVRAPHGWMMAGYTSSVAATITEAVPVMDLWHFHHCHERSSLRASCWSLNADQHLREQVS